MAYDNILGVGKIPGKQPAILIDNQEQTVGAGTVTSTITFADPMRLLYLQGSVNFKLTVGAHDGKPVIRLLRNGQEIERLQYEATLSAINGFGTDKLLYSISGQRIDFLSKGDTFALECDVSDGHSVGTATIYVTLSIIGQYV